MASCIGVQVDGYNSGKLSLDGQYLGQGVQVDGYNSGKLSLDGQAIIDISVGPLNCPLVSV